MDERKPDKWLSKNKAIAALAGAVTTVTMVGCGPSESAPAPRSSASETATSTLQPGDSEFADGVMTAQEMKNYLQSDERHEAATAAIQGVGEELQQMFESGELGEYETVVYADGTAELGSLEDEGLIVVRQLCNPGPREEDIFPDPEVREYIVNEFVYTHDGESGPKIAGVRIVERDGERHIKEYWLGYRYTYEDANVSTDFSTVKTTYTSTKEEHERSLNGYAEPEVTIEDFKQRDGEVIDYMTDRATEKDFSNIFVPQLS